MFLQPASWRSTALRVGAEERESRRGGGKGNVLPSPLGQKTLPPDFGPKFSGGGGAAMATMTMWYGQAAVASSCRRLNSRRQHS
eukprot:362298-Chlamydomonas_euryale.AAC.7